MKVTYDLLQYEAMNRLQNFLLLISCLKTIHLRMYYLQMYDCKFPFFPEWNLRYAADTSTNFIL